MAVGVSSDFRRFWNLNPSNRIDTPAFAPLALGRHVALERGKKTQTRQVGKHWKKEGGVKMHSGKFGGALMKHGIKLEVGVCIFVHVFFWWRGAIGQD